VFLVRAVLINDIEERVMAKLGEIVRKLHQVILLVAGVIAINNAEITHDEWGKEIVKTINKKVPKNCKKEGKMKETLINQVV